MAVDYVRVVYGKVSASIDLDRKIRTFSDIAEAAAVKHIGLPLHEAHVPLCSLSLRGPVALTDDLTDTVLAALRGMDTVSLGRVIDPTRVTGGAWFLLEIDIAKGTSALRELREGGGADAAAPLASASGYSALPSGTAACTSSRSATSADFRRAERASLGTASGLVSAGLMNSEGFVLPVVLMESGFAGIVSVETPTGLFFLADEAVSQCIKWADVPFSGQSVLPRCLGIVGSVKCGKTTLLQLLPGFVARCPRTAQAAVFFSFSFADGEPPGIAAKRLLMNAAEFGASFEIELTIPVDADTCFVMLADIMGRLTEALLRRGSQLFLLLDESQAPILAAATPADAKAFTSKLKHIIGNMWKFGGRLAFTASGILALLNALQAVPPNDFTLWDSVARVHLGASPSQDVAILMAQRIFDTRAQNLPAALTSIVTPEAVVEHLTPLLGAAALPITTPRPALIAFLFDLVCAEYVTTTTAPTVLDRAIEKLVRKLMLESRDDSATALSAMSPEYRRCIFSLAHSGQSGTLLSNLVAPSLGGHNFRELVESLCEPVPADVVSSGASASERPMRLLPPYGALLNSMLGTDGTLLVTLTRGTWELGDALLRTLVFLYENERIVLRSSAVACGISVAVLNVLASNGIVVGNGSVVEPAAIASVERVPVVMAVLDVLGDGKSLTDFKTGVATSDAAYSRSFGFRFLVWLRHLHAHSFVARSPLTDVGLTASVVQQAATAAFNAGVSLGAFALVNGAPSVVAPAVPPLGVAFAMGFGGEADTALVAAQAAGWGD